MDSGCHEKSIKTGTLSKNCSKISNDFILSLMPKESQTRSLFIDDTVDINTKILL